jgi:PA domain
MRKENRQVHKQRKSWPRSVHLVIVAAAVSIAVPAAAAQQQAIAAAQRSAAVVESHLASTRDVSSTAKRTPAPSLRQITLPGMTGQSYTVTLPTGDQVRLVSAGAGRYAVTAAPAAASDGVAITAVGNAHAATSLFAFPVAAGALIRDGLVDRQLFDVRWLATHGDAGASGTLPVTLEYTGARPGALPGATVVAATSTTVSLKVRADHAARFWAALTGATRPGAPVPSLARQLRLTAGIARAWPTGNRTMMQVTPADQMLYNVTENVTFTRSVIGGSSTLDIGVPLIYGVSGAGEGQSYFATGTSCLDTACTAVQITYSAPTGIYLIEDNSATFAADDHVQILNLSVPQLTVAGNTTVSVNADKASHLTMATPRPSVPYESILEDIRTSPDQTWETSAIVAFYSTAAELWALPTTAPVTVGRYHSTALAQLGPPPVTMSVTAPQRLALDVTYPFYTNVAYLSFTRFSGSRSMSLAYAGYGTAQDFAGTDVHGKLVLIRPAPGDWTIERSQMDNALQAGAAGVLGIPTSDTYGNSFVPWTPGWNGDGKPAPALPFAEIPAREANTLINLLQQGPVQIRVTDTSASSYLYNLTFSTEGLVPASLGYTVTDAQLEQVNTSYQYAQPGVLGLQASVIRPGDQYVFGYWTDFTAPHAFQMYYGPSDPEVFWWRTPVVSASPTSPLRSIWAYDVYDQPHADSEVWFDQSEVPGATTLADDVFQAQPGELNGNNHETYCSFCRQGDMFFPLFDMVSAQSPRLLDALYTFDPSQMHLYLNGTEIPQSQFHGVPVYQLPPQQGQYRLIAAAGNLDTDWTFSSGHPTHTGMSDGYFCYGWYYHLADPCAATPMIMLRYNAFASLGNAVTAGGRQRLQITTYDQATSQPTDIASLKFWTSTDGGATWQQARVSRGGNGSFWADYSVPALGDTSRTLSIRAQAADAAGDTINQTYYNDYTLIAGR